MPTTLRQTLRLRMIPQHEGCSYTRDPTMLTMFLLVVSLAMLTLGAESLVRGSAALAKRMGVSSFFIGLTIVGFGTSTPELGTGITAAMSKVDDVVMGNVIGSNIVNIAAILGLGSLIAPTPVKMRQVRGETTVVIGLSFIPFFALLTGGYIPRFAGVIMVASLAIYLWRSYRKSRREADLAAKDLEKELEHELGLDRLGWRSKTWVSLAMVGAGLLLLIVGARMLLDTSLIIARSLGVSDLVIGLTVIAVGTSAPELFTTVMAALRKQSDIAVGNILGSNIFNLLGILGATSIVAPQRVGAQVLWLDAPLMILLSIALLPIMSTRAKISRWEGGTLLAVYITYTIFLFTSAPVWFPSAVPAP